MARKTTQTRVALNAKLESVNLQAIQTNGSVAFEEGWPVALDASTGMAARPAAGATSVVYVNFVDSTRTDTEFLQRDPFDTTSPQASIQSGGLSGIQGVHDIGLPADAWDSGALPAVGTLVQVAASGQFTSITAVAAARHYGVIYRVKENRAFFHFHSTPISW
jgi:hypothetical protein